MDNARKIENLIYQYAEHIDKGDLEKVAELFTEAELISPEHGTRIQGYEAVLELYEKSCRIHETAGTPLTKHLTTNVIVEVSPGGESAHARSYYTVIQATDTLALQPIISGRYHDKFRKSGGDAWQFEYREMYIDLMGDCSEHLLYAV